MLNEFLRRPLEVLASSFDLLGKDLPFEMKINAILSRSMHGMSHPFPNLYSPQERSTLQVPRENSGEQSGHDSRKGI